VDNKSSSTVSSVKSDPVTSSATLSCPSRARQALSGILMVTHIHITPNASAWFYDHVVLNKRDLEWAERRGQLKVAYSTSGYLTSKSEELLNVAISTCGRNLRKDERRRRIR
jgi:hypothetical protein